MVRTARARDRLNLQTHNVKYPFAHCYRYNNAHTQTHTGGSSHTYTKTRPVYALLFGGVDGYDDDDDDDGVLTMG